MEKNGKTGVILLGNVPISGCCKGGTNHAGHSTGELTQRGKHSSKRQQVMGADGHYKILCFPKDVPTALQGSSEVLG